MDLTEMVKAGEQLFQHALDAVGKYHEARDSSVPEAEVERLRVEAESLVQIVREYQVRALGSSQH